MSSRSYALWILFCSSSSVTAAIKISACWRSSKSVGELAPPAKRFLDPEVQSGRGTVPNRHFCHFAKGCPRPRINPGEGTAPPGGPRTPDPEPSQTMYATIVAKRVIGRRNVPRRADHRIIPRVLGTGFSGSKSFPGPWTWVSGPRTGITRQTVKFPGPASWF